MSLFALGAFWVAAIYLWVTDGAKIPLIFMALWFAAFFGFSHLGLNGYFFLAFEALLAAILFLIAKYKSSL
jgi:hypothetical protein